jgi:hypothetical protein
MSDERKETLAENRHITVVTLFWKTIHDQFLSELVMML